MPLTYARPVRTLRRRSIVGGLLVTVIAAGCSDTPAPTGDVAVCKAIAKLGSHGPRPTGAFARDAINDIHSVGKRTDTPLGEIARNAQAVDGQLAFKAGDNEFVATRCRDLGAAVRPDTTTDDRSSASLSVPPSKARVGDMVTATLAVVAGSVSP
jgi:hypothetical protein